MNDAAVAAILFALDAESPMEFLRCWVHGGFDVIRKEWPEAPRTVFDGAEADLRGDSQLQSQRAPDPHDGKNGNTLIVRPVT